MALQTGTLFKYIAFQQAPPVPPASPYQFIAKMRNTKLVSGVKFDNITSSCTILVRENDFSDIDTIYDYKYFTIDNSNVFEITNCRQIDKLYVLNLVFVSNFQFDAPDKDMIITGVTPISPTHFFLSYNELREIIGAYSTQSFIYRHAYFPEMESNIKPQYFAVKISFSEYPENMTRCCTSSGFVSSGITSPKDLSALPTRTYNPRIPAANITYSDYSKAVTFSDENSLFIIVPMSGKNDMRIQIKTATTTSVFVYSVSTFLSALKALISDLTTSVEISIIDEDSFSLVTYSNGNFFPAKLEFVATDTISISFPTVSGTADVGDMIRCLSNNNTPLFVTKNSASNKTSGIYEFYDFIQMPKLSSVNTSGKVINNALAVRILGQLIDVSAARGGLFLKRQKDGVRLYIDFEHNDFVDVPLTLEFSQTAFSNYESYKKANLDAEFFAQQRELKQNQINTAINNIIATLFGNFNSANAAYSAGAAAASGDIGGVFSAGMSRFMNGAQSVEQSIALSVQQAQERKKLALQHSNQREIERTKIVPTQKISGTVSFSDFLGVMDSSLSSVTIIYEYLSFTFGIPEKMMLSRYFFENKILERKMYPLVPLPVNPEWVITNDGQEKSIAQIEFSNINPQSTRQGGIVLGRFE